MKKLLLILFLLYGCAKKQYQQQLSFGEKMDFGGCICLCPTYFKGFGTVDEPLHFSPIEIDTTIRFFHEGKLIYFIPVDTIWFKPRF